MVNIYMHKIKNVADQDNSEHNFLFIYFCVFLFTILFKHLPLSMPNKNIDYFRGYILVVSFSADWLSN